MIGAKEKGFIWFNRYLEVSEGLNRSVINLLKITRKKVLSMPLTHLHNVEGEIIRFFSIINQDIPFNSKYEKHIKMGNKNPFDKEIKTWLDFNEKEDTFLIINDLTYKRLVELRFWARDVIIKSWMEYLIKHNTDSIDEHSLSQFNIIYNTDLNRDQNLVSHYREFYENFKLFTCIYTGYQLNPSEYHLDHFIPWKYYPVNRFWNLYPSTVDANLEKGDHLPEWTKSVEERIMQYLEKCIKKQNNWLIQNDLQYFYTIVQKEEKISKSNDKSRIVEEIRTYIQIELENIQKIIPGSRFSVN